MPPKQSRQRKNPSASHDDIDQFPVPPTGSAASPWQSRQGKDGEPSFKRVKISVEQRQQLVDNLRLEITNRARRLRAQYHAQAQAMRTRLQIRVARIPSHMRKTTMGELAEKWREIGTQALEKPLAKPTTTLKSNKNDATAAPEQKRPDTATTASSAAADSRHHAPVQVAKTRNNKRKSAQIYEDEPQDDLAETMSVKRTRVDAVRAAPAPGPGSRLAQSRILSPKSNNSRTFPQSPFKSLASPAKRGIARPTSPAKSSAPAVAAVPTASSLAKSSDKAKGGSAASKATGKKAMTGAGATTRPNNTAAATARAPRPVTRTSNRATKAAKAERTSDLSATTSASSGTTVVKKVAASKPASKTATTKGTSGRTKAAASAAAKLDDKKAAVAKKPGLVSKLSNLASKAGATEGRSLRTRAK